MSLVRNPRRRPPSNVRAERKLEKRERIREAAWELFTRDGLEATTTKAIAARAGIAAGTLFLYARDKQDLLFLVFHDRISETLDHAFATVPPDAPLLEQVVHVFRELLLLYRDHPPLTRAFVSAVRGGADSPNAAAMRALTLANQQRIAELVVAAQRRGEVAADVPAVLAANNFFGLYIAVLTAWLSGFGSFETALIQLRASIGLQVRGLRP